MKTISFLLLSTVAAYAGETTQAALDAAKGYIEAHGFNCPKALSVSATGVDEIGNKFAALCYANGRGLQYDMSINPKTGEGRVVFTGKL